MSTVASTTIQLLRGRFGLPGGVVLTASARMRSLPWEDAPEVMARCGAPRGVHPHAG